MWSSQVWNLNTPPPETGLGPGAWGSSLFQSAVYCDHGGGWDGEVFKLSLLELVLPGRCRDITVEPKRSDRRYLDLLLMVVPVEKGGFLQGWTSRGQLPHSPRGRSGTSWVWCLPPQSSQLCICSALGRKDFCFPPFSLLEREKISGLHPRHIERMRHHGRHQALC